MTLQQELDARARRIHRKTAARTEIAAYQRGVDELAAAEASPRGPCRPAATPRRTSRLPNARGEAVTLSELLAHGPVVITFYRGGWCPYCNLQLRAYQRVLPEIRALGARLVAISPEAPDNTLSTAEKNELEFEVLSDVKGEVGRAYRLLFELSDELQRCTPPTATTSRSERRRPWHLPMPATYVIAPTAG